MATGGPYGPDQTQRIWVCHLKRQASSISCQVVDVRKVSLASWCERPADYMALLCPAICLPLLFVRPIASLSDFNKWPKILCNLLHRSRPQRPQQPHQTRSLPSYFALMGLHSVCSINRVQQVDGPSMPRSLKNIFQWYIIRRRIVTYSKESNHLYFEYPHQVLHRIQQQHLHSHIATERYQDIPKHHQNHFIFNYILRPPLSMHYVVPSNRHYLVLVHPHSWVTNM